MLTRILTALIVAAALAAPALAAPQNFFANPSFEDGREGWNLGKAAKTEATFTVEKGEAAAGQMSALVKIGKVEEWGVQFGQSFDAGKKGKTYTFAAVLRAVKDPVTVRLEIERSAKPWDRAVASDKTTVKSDAWTEIHVTFEVQKDFAEGWFAYVSCNEANTAFRLDMVRLYEGPYVPYEKVAKEEMQASGGGVALFDTGATAAAPIPGDALPKHAGWTQVAEDATPKLKGDAVITNDRVALVLRRGAAGAELYGIGPKGATLRATLAPQGGGQAAKLESVTVAKNGAAAVGVDAAFKAADGKTLALKYELAAGQVYVTTTAADGTKALGIEAAGRFAILPDFFADDIVVDAADVKGATAELPSENFLMQLVGDGDAVVLSVSADRTDDFRIGLSGEGSSRVVVRSEIPYGKGAKTWVAVIEGPGVWHQRTVAKDEAGKIVQVGWKMPCPAQWRVDWRRADGLTDSWEMLLERPGGQFDKPGWFADAQTVPADRKRWTTVLGSIQYPCWIDKEGQGWFQPLKERLSFQGPALIYPINRVKGTPLGTFTVADIMRATLGVGPCEYILDLEGQTTWYKGRATCSTRDVLRGIYSKKEQKAKRAEVEKALQDVVLFVKVMRARIEQYVEWSHKMLQYLDEQKKAHPELADFFADMETRTKVIEANVDRRRSDIKTPQYVIDLTDKFRKELLDDESDGAFPKVKEITEQIVVVGGNQDELTGESRLAVKVLRQKAGLAMANDPRTAEIAKEIRKRCQEIMRNGSSYESPRH